MTPQSPADEASTTAAHWRQVKRLFAEANACPSAELATFLDRLRRRDPRLHAEVASLLEADHQSLPWLDGDVLAASPDLLSSQTAGHHTGTRVGPYTLDRELGRGGMGTVYLAVRTDDAFHQEVAVKLIKRGMDSDEIVDRFRRERQILASLAHPNISRLLDGGQTDQGQPYFVMERIVGEPIDRYCTDHKLPITRRLELMREVCQAVHHAHGNLVVHRDIKPGNVLVTADGTPKLLDFGIAKLLAADHVPFHTAITANGAVPLTAAFASPEQLRGEPIATASDIYSLGVLLYRLLTGRLPYRLGGRSPRAAERIVHEAEPPAPSTVVNTALTRRQQRARRRQLAGDLDNIVAKALDKDPSRRYASAAQLAEDLRRHQVGLPVIARPDTALYLAGRLIRRHRVGALATVLIALSLIGGFATTVWQAQEARTQRRHAQQEAATADHVADFLAGVLQETDPFGRTGEALSVRALLDRAAARIDEDLQDQPLVRARVLDTLGVALGRNDAFEQAEQLLSEAIAIRSREAGAHATETAESLLHYGALERRRGNFETAEDHVRQALAIRESHFGERAKETIAAVGELASVLRERGDFGTAEPLARRALDMNRVLFTADSVQTAESLNDLALLLSRTGELAEAESLFRKAVSVYRAQHGDVHVSVAVGLQNLADVLYQRGKLEPAIVASRESVEIYRQVAGDGSTYVASGLNTLGVLLKNAGRHHEAKVAYREALELRRRLLGSEHPSVGRTASNLATMLMEQGELVAAEALLTEALATARRSYGERHASVALKLGQLGRLRLHQGQPKAARVLFQQALSTLRRTAGPSHPHTASMLLGLGRAQLLLDTPGDAEASLREALSIRQAAFEAGHVAIADAQSWLGAALVAQGRFATAEPLLIEGHRGLVAARGEKHAATREASARLQSLYRSWQRPG